MGYFSLEEEILMWPFRFFFRLNGGSVRNIIYVAELIFQWTAYALIISSLRNNENTTTI